MKQLSLSLQKTALLGIFICVGMIIGVLGAMILAPSNAAAREAQSTAAFTYYYNMIGYEGIGTLGSSLQANGGIPPVGDYVSTHCRYIDVQNTTIGHYYLRYPLHLPDDTTITKVSLHVADFNSSGALWAYLRMREWDSRDDGSMGFTNFATTSSSLSDQTISFNPNLEVDNQTYEYWIDVSPQNGADPGQLCVYGIQVTYTSNGTFLPLIFK